MDRINEVNVKIEEMINEIMKTNDENVKEREKILVRGVIKMMIYKYNNDKIKDRMIKMFNNEMELKLEVGALRNKNGMKVNKCIKIIEELDGILSNGDEMISKERKKSVKKAQSLLKVADRIFDRSNKLIQFINNIINITITTTTAINNNSTATANVDTNKDTSQHPQPITPEPSMETELNVDNEQEEREISTPKSSHSSSSNNSNSDGNANHSDDESENDDDKMKKFNAQKEKLKEIKILNERKRKQMYKTPEYKIREGDDEVLIDIELPNGLNVERDIKFAIDENKLDRFGIIGFNEPLEFSIDPRLVNVTQSTYKVLSQPSFQSQSQPIRILRVSIPRRRISTTSQSRSRNIHNEHYGYPHSYGYRPSYYSPFGHFYQDDD